MDRYSAIQTKGRKMKKILITVLILFVVLFIANAIVRSFVPIGFRGAVGMLFGFGCGFVYAWITKKTETTDGE